MNKRGVLAGGILLCLLTGPLFADDIQGVMMKDGTMVVMADGKATGPMQKEMTTTDGQKVTTDGTIKKTNGSTSHLKDGQMMMKDGKMMTAHGEMGMEKGMGMKDKGMGMGMEKMKEGTDMATKPCCDKPTSPPPQK